MHRRSLKHDAATQMQGPLSNNTAWVTPSLGGSIYGSATLGKDLLFVPVYSTPKGAVHAIDISTGASRWSVETGGPVGSTPLFIEDLSMVVFGADDGKLYAVDSDSGSLLWTYTHHEALQRKFQIAASPIYAPGPNGKGRLFIGTLDRTGDIFALEIHGRDVSSVLWQLSAGGVPGTCAFDSEELFVGSNNGQLYAIGAEDGNVHWTAQTNGIVYSSPAISADGSRVFVGSNDGTMYAFNRSTGEKLWGVFTPGWVDSSPAIDSDGNVFVCVSNGNAFQNYAIIYKIDGSTGEVIWQDEINDADGLYDPVIAGGTVYASSVSDDTQTGYAGGDLRAWDAASGERLWTLPTGGHVGVAAAVGSTGELYIGDRIGQVYKVADQSNSVIV